MYSPTVRLVLVLLCVVGAVLGFYRGAPTGWLFTVAAALFTLGYWRNASVWLAWRAFKRGDMSRVRRLVAATPSPQRLSPQQRAYFEWLQGELTREAGNPQAACQHFRAAAAGKLRSTHDRAFAYARLAEASLAAQDLAGAYEAIANARQLSPSPFVEALLRDLEESVTTTP
jgi:hypothetical protein